MANAVPRWQRRTILVIAMLGAFFFIAAVHYLELIPDLEFNLETRNSGVDSQVNPKSSSSVSTPFSTSSPGSRPESESPINDEHLQSEGNKEHNPFLTMFPERPPGDQELFLGYIPHSGFHNQRIELQNALRLATYLNRTLLLPPLYSFTKFMDIGWGRPSVLLKWWSELTREHSQSCRNLDPTQLAPITLDEYHFMTPKEREQDCRVYHSWTLTPWTYVFNIPKVIQGVVGIGGQTEPIRVFDRSNVTIAWMAEHLGITDLDKEVYWLNSTSRWDFQILDDSVADYRLNSSPNLRSYDQELLLSDLKARPERVIHFGTFFGSDRVKASSQAHVELQQYIEASLNIWNQKIFDATELVGAQIDKWRILTARAAPGFLGAHIRVENKQFVGDAGQNLELLALWLRNMTNLPSINITSPIQHSAPAQAQLPPNTTEPQQQEPPTFLERCMGQPPESPLLYVATDVHHPRLSPVFADFLNEFPCTMILSDFPESAQFLDRIRNPVDNIRMLPFLTALLDANLVAHGRQFHGTEGSTFSQYISNPLWSHFHPS
ncbi:hypothetical protein EDD21DRAFT_375758 [Dissophora ornata]|nr:hypothetical protein BGZ58_003001 [Dissophora ornata]KAI8600971.1 hypothetical protein EDD21DRAFT_375758 [Dissophora ornata]